MLIKFLESNIDLLADTAVSNLTKKWYELRMNGGETEIKLNSAIYNTQLFNDYLELVFFAKATYGNTSYVASVDLPQAPNGWYTLALRFYKVKSILGKDFNTIGYKEIESRLKKAIHQCDVKFYSDDPSWFFQGGFELADKNKMSIYKYTGPKGTGVWENRHKSSGGVSAQIYLTKHLAQVIHEIDNYITEIAQNIKVL